jgi:hypothetical protein
MSYRDESDIFYDDARRFLEVYSDNILGNKTWKHEAVRNDLLPVPGQTYQIRKIRWPSHVVFFEALWNPAGLEEIFAGSDYSLVSCNQLLSYYFLGALRI